MYSTELYARLGDGDRPRPGLARRRRAADGHHARARRRSCSAPAERGHHLRARARPARRRPRRSERLPLLNVDDVTRRRPGCPATATSTPSCSARRWPTGARGQGVALHTGVARRPASSVDGDRVDRRRRPTAGTIADRDRGDRGRRRHRRASGALAGASIPIVPDAPPVRGHRAARPERRRGHHHRPRPRPHHVLPPARLGRAARRRLLARPGHLGHRRAAGRAADARSTPDMERFAESWEGARNRVPALRDARDRPRSSTAPEAFTPDGEFILGETRGRRPLGRRRLLRARPRRRRRRRQGHRRVDRRRPARVDIAVDGHPPLRRATTRRRRYARTRALERLLALLRHRLPARGVRRRAAAAPLARLPAAARARRRASARRPAGSA